VPCSVRARLQLADSITRYGENYRSPKSVNSVSVDLMRYTQSSFALIFAAGVALLVTGCATSNPEGRATPARTAIPRLEALNVHLALLPPNEHGRLVNRTMQPRYLTIHSTENRGATAAQHARLLLGTGKRSRNNPRFGRSGWVTWHFTVDDHEAYEHLLATEQGDHADYGGPGDTESIGIEICEFREPSRQAAAIDRAARITAALANRYGIPTQNIVPHKHWPRWDFKYGKPCPRILLDRDRHSPGGWRIGAKWDWFLRLVDGYR
jgi:N-acetylmuramoyl-L-alanine amidase